MGMYTKDRSEDQVKEVTGEEYYTAHYAKTTGKDEYLDEMFKMVADNMKVSSINSAVPITNFTLAELVERFLTKDKLPPVGKEVAIYFYNKFSKRYILASGWYDDGWYIYGFDPYEKVEVMGWFELSEIKEK